MRGKARLRLSPNEEAQLVREELDRRRKLRLQQVRLTALPRQNAGAFVVFKLFSVSAAVAFILDTRELDCVQCAVF